MRKNGRWSQDDQRRVALPAARPPLDPPDGLDEPERAIWQGIVSKLPGDWFAPEAVPLLKELVRHVRNADDLAVDLASVRAGRKLIEAAELTEAERLAQLKTSSTALHALLRAQGYQSERIGNLATKLRLTNQSKDLVTAAARKRADQRPTPQAKPWDDWKNDDADTSGTRN